MYNMEVITFDQITSTNDYLKENYLKYNSYTFVKTNYQTKGRGQFNRTWLSTKDKNLLFSLLLKDIKINDIIKIKDTITNSLLTFLINHNIKGVFKEPNDILIDNEKILGILIETKTLDKEKFGYVVIGIGININQTKFNNLNATSFKLLNKINYNIQTLFNEIKNIIYKNLIKVI